MSRASDRPILFSAPMVRAILDGRKMQTRRVLTTIRRFGRITEFGPSDTRGYDWHFRDPGKRWHDLRGLEMLQYLRFAVGDRLWVRENIRAEELPNGRDGVRFLSDDVWLPIESTPDAADRWVALNHYGQGRGTGPRVGRRVPSIHMPRWASRLTLHVTDVRVERLRAISEDDALAEGVAPEEGYWRDYLWPTTQICTSPVESFGTLWTSINGPDSWTANPWVAAVTFEAERANIDASQPARAKASQEGA